MSSLASARKGRPNRRRDSDSELVPNTIRVVGNFRREIYAALGETPMGVFEIFVDCLSSPEVGEFIDLDAETLSILDDVTVTRGPLPTFKYQLFRNRTEMLTEGFVTLDPDAAILDLNHARTATESEIRDALDYEPAPVKPPAPVAPTFKRIPRKEGDSASYLGFSVGGGDERIKLARGTTICGFHLASPQVISKIDATLSFPPHSNSYVELSVFNASGDRRLYLELTAPTAQFDQIRLEAGDHLLVMRCVRGAIEGTGSYKYPNSRVIADLPTKPDIDALLWGDQSDMAPGVRCAVPCFEWTSR